MCFTNGLIIGLILSTLSITSMVLVARFSLLKGWKYGFSAALGAYLSQAIFALIAVIAILFLHTKVLIHTGSSVESIVGVYIIAGLLLLVAYDLYKEPMPAAEKLTKISITHPFMLVFSKAIRRLTRLAGYLALITVFIAKAPHLTIGTGGELFVGIIIPMALWWTIFLILVNKLQGKISPKGIHHFNKIGATIVVLFALGLLFSLWF